jgi:hypothetical protein
MLVSFLTPLYSYGEASFKDTQSAQLFDLLEYGGANVYVRNYQVCRKLQL